MRVCAVLVIVVEANLYEFRLWREDSHKCPVGLHVADHIALLVDIAVLRLPAVKGHALRRRPVAALHGDVVALIDLRRGGERRIRGAIRDSDLIRIRCLRSIFLPDTVEGQRSIKRLNDRIRIFTELKDVSRIIRLKRPAKERIAGFFMNLAVSRLIAVDRLDALTRNALIARFDDQILTVLRIKIQCKSVILCRKNRRHKSDHHDKAQDQS